MLSSFYSHCCRVEYLEVCISFSFICFCHLHIPKIQLFLRWVSCDIFCYKIIYVYYYITILSLTSKYFRFPFIQWWSYNMFYWNRCRTKKMYDLNVKFIPCFFSWIIPTFNPTDKVIKRWRLIIFQTYLFVSLLTITKIK